MSADARWVRVSTSMLDHEMFDGEPYSKRDAWLWLIANAAWKDRRVNHKGTMITLKRGQVLAGRAYLAEKWGWGEQKVRTFVHLLVSENAVEINQSDGRFANVLTICNYTKYQTVQSDVNQSSNQTTTRRQPDDNQTLTRNTNTTNKNTTTPSESDAAREADGGTDDPYVVKCKLALNGTTDRAIDIVRNADGPYGTKAGAAQWLAELIDDTSPDAVLQAVRFFEGKRDRHEPVHSPKSIIAKTARTASGNAAASHAVPRAKPSIERQKALLASLPELLQ